MQLYFGLGARARCVKSNWEALRPQALRPQVDGGKERHRPQASKSCPARHQAAGPKGVLFPFFLGKPGRNTHGICAQQEAAIQPLQASAARAAQGVLQRRAGSASYPRQPGVSKSSTTPLARPRWQGVWKGQRARVGEWTGQLGNEPKKESRVTASRGGKNTHLGLLLPRRSPPSPPS